MLVIEYIETTNELLKLKNINILAERNNNIKFHLFFCYIILILVITFIIYVIFIFKQSREIRKLNENVQMQEITYNALLQQVNKLTQNNSESGAIHLRKG